MGALDDAEHSDDLVVGFDHGFLGEVGERVDEALDGCDLHDDDVVVHDAIYVGIIGGKLRKDGFEFGLIVLELRIDGAGRVEWIGRGGGEKDGIDLFWGAVRFEVGFEEGGRRGTRGRGVEG